MLLIKVLGILKKWIKDIQQSVEVNNTILKKTEDQIEELQYLSKMEIDIDYLESIQSTLQKTYQRNAALVKQIDNLKANEEKNK